MVVWKLFLDNLEFIAFYASVIAAAVGFAAFNLVLLRWKWVAPLYREFLAKLGVASFRFVAAASAVASKAAPVPPDTPLTEQPWATTTLIAFVGYLLWELVGAVGDHKYKLDKEKSKTEHEQEIQALTQDKNDAEQQYIRLGWVVAHVRTLVNEKLRRVKEVVRSSTGSRASLPQTRGALSPDQQIAMILEALASLLHTGVVSSGGPYNQNFRIGLYAEQEGCLVPLDAFDLNTRRHDPFTSYSVHKDRFRLDNTVNPSHAVRCVREGRMLIVPDCANHPEFQYFHAQQPNYLRSMAAYPLSDFSLDGGAPIRAALLIDTDAAGFFREEDSEFIEKYLIEFAVRLALEYAIRGLVS